MTCKEEKEKLRLEKLFRSHGHGGRVNFILNVTDVEWVSVAYGCLPVSADWVYLHVQSKNGTGYMAGVDRSVFMEFMAGVISAADLCDVVAETAVMEQQEDEDGRTIAPIMTAEEVKDFICVAR